MTTTLPGVIVTDDREAIHRVIVESSHAKRIVVIIPAHNEAGSIAATIASIQTQTCAPTVIIVAANNCTDGTEEAARAAGAYVFLAEPNRDRKAGALNLTLDYVMGELRDTDTVLVADADTLLSADFIEIALDRLSRGRVGAVGGAFVGRPSKTTIGLLQSVEFQMYRCEIAKHAERAFVVSGTGALFNVAALREVKASRNGRRLPEGDGYYDTHSATEDNEMTLALLTCGWECISPADMTTVTDVMETPKALWNQRLRWYLGAMRNLAHYGRQLPWHLKYKYWGQQFGLVRAVALWILQLIITCTVAFVDGRGIVVVPFWLALHFIVQFTKVSIIWKMGWRACWVTFFLEPLYCIYLLLIFCGGLSQFFAGKKGDWVAT